MEEKIQSGLFLLTTLKTYFFPFLSNRQFRTLFRVHNFSHTDELAFPKEPEGNLFYF